MQVLWVDDQPGDSPEFMRVLVERGWHVTNARNVVEAIMCLDSESFDLLILDIQIPLGPVGGDQRFEDLAYNGVHVYIRMSEKSCDKVPQVICLTNFEHAARQHLGSEVTVLSKAIFIETFRKEIEAHEPK